MRVNNINSNTFTGKLILPVRKKNEIKKLELDAKDIVQIDTTCPANTIINYKDYGEGAYASIEPATIPLRSSTFLTAYNSAIAAPPETEINLY